MKNIMLYAYTAFNLGDDLFIKILCERYPNANFTLYAPKEYKISLKSIENLKVIPNNTLVVRSINFILRVLKLKFSLRELISKNNDAAVYIGGSIFMQHENWEKKYIEKKNMLIRGKPFFVIGANFGPFKEREFFIKYKEMFKQYTDICFRDLYSYELFMELDNIRVADDVVFQLGPKDLRVHQQNEYIVISVIKPSYRKYLADFDNIYYDKIKDITIKFIDKGYQVTLMSFCEREGDKEAIQSIRDLLPESYLNQVNDYFYKYNIEEALDIIAKSNFVVGTRFHAMILGWVYNKPVFPIVYSEKMTNVMKDIHFQGIYTDFNNIHKLKPEEVYNSMKTNIIDVSQQIKNAERQFEKLDEYLLN